MSVCSKVQSLQIVSWFMYLICLYGTETEYSMCSMTEIVLFQMNAVSSSLVILDPSQRQ